MNQVYIKNNNKINLYTISILNRSEISSIMSEIKQKKSKNHDKLLNLCSDLLNNKKENIYQFSINLNNVITNKNYNKRELTFLKRILKNIEFKKVLSTEIVSSDIIISKKRTIIDKILGKKEEKSTIIEVPLELEEHINEELEILENIKLKCDDKISDKLDQKIKSKLYDKFPKISEIRKNE